MMDAGSCAKQGEMAPHALKERSMGGEVTVIHAAHGSLLKGLLCYSIQSDKFLSSHSTELKPSPPRPNYFKGASLDLHGNSS